MSRSSYATHSFVTSSENLPACDAYIDWLGFPRNKTDFWDDCSSKVVPRDSPSRRRTHTYEELKEFKREVCSAWYNDPWVGSAKICDGPPVQNENLDWVCQPGTECSAP